MKLHPIFPGGRSHFSLNSWTSLTPEMESSLWLNFKSFRTFLQGYTAFLSGPVAQSVECPFRWTGGYWFNPGLRHTKVIKNGTSHSLLANQTYMVELGLMYQCQDNDIKCLVSGAWYKVSVARYESRQANLCLRAFRHDKFQLRMPSHSEGPRIWLSVWRFLLIHCLYERAAKILARLRGCAGSPEPLLLA